MALFGEGEWLPAAIVLEAAAREQAVFFEGGEQLRDCRGRDGGTAGELGSEDLSLGDRLQRQVLRDGERRIVRREQPIDPAADEWRRAYERLRCLTAADSVTRPRQ